MRKLAGALVALATPVAGAQCEPGWDPAIGDPGITSGFVGAFGVWDDGNGEAIFAGGSFENIAGTGAELFARYDPRTGTWSRPAGGLDPGFTNGFVEGTAVFQDKLVVGGFFNNADGVPDTQSIAAWDGTEWSSLGGMLVSPEAVWGLTVADLGAGERLYAVGSFESMGGVSGKGVAAYDGKAWSAVGSGIGIDGSFSPFAQSAIAFDDGSGMALYICGRFQSVDGVSAASIARFDGESWSRLGDGITSTNSLFGMEDMAIFDDGSGPALYVSGFSHRINGQGNDSFQVLRWDGQEWSGVGQNIGTGRITQIEAFDDGSGETLYIGGTAMPQINQLARLENGQWVIAEGGVGGPPIPNANFPSVFGLGTYRNNLLVGGSFGSTGDGQSADGVAMLMGCAQDCPADLTGPGGDGVPDGDLTADDFFFYLGLFAAADPEADLTGPGGDGVPDGDLTADDFFFYLGLFAGGCP